MSTDVHRFPLFSMFVHLRTLHSVGFDQPIGPLMIGLNIARFQEGHYILQLLALAHYCPKNPSPTYRYNYALVNCMTHPLYPWQGPSLLSHWQFTSESHVRHFTSIVSHWCDSCVRYFIAIVYQGIGSVSMCVTLVTIWWVTLHELSVNEVHQFTWIAINYSTMTGLAGGIGGVSYNWRVHNSWLIISG